MKHRVVAIIGRKRSGKDTLASYLCANYNFKNVKFAQPLKDATASLFGLSREQVENNSKDEIDEFWGITPRRLMQILGTEIMQQYLPSLISSQKLDKHFFVHRLLKDIASNEEYSDANIVVSDMRFLHEYSYLKHVYPNIVVIRVTRKSTDDDKDYHVSEREFESIPFDVEILNNECITQLHLAFEDQLQTIFKPQ